MTANQLKYWELQETTRSHLANEDVNEGKLRVDQGKLRVDQDTISETGRHNLTVENLTRAYNESAQAKMGAETHLTNAKTEGQVIDNKYKDAEHIVGLFETGASALDKGTHAIKNVTGSVKDMSDVALNPAKALSGLVPLIG